MAYLQKKGDRTRFHVIDANCLGRDCFRPGHYQTRGGTPSGSRNTGQSSPCCMRNAYHGCPTERDPNPELAAQRKRDGWKAIGF